MEYTITGFHHFAIKAQDLEATVRFYETLGFETVHSWSLPEFSLKQCVMMRNASVNCHIEICDKDANFPSQGRKHEEGEEYVQNAIMHICFTVTNAAAAFQAALKNGARPLSDKETLFLDSGPRSVSVSNSLVYSPNGEVIEFLEQVVF